MDSVDRDVKILGVFEESRLELCYPHLVIKLVVVVVIASHLQPTVEMIYIKDSEMMDA